MLFLELQQKIDFNEKKNVSQICQKKITSVRIWRQVVENFWSDLEDKFLRRDLFSEKCPQATS